MQQEIKVYDTTLRDGSQGEGISFTLEDKLRLVAALDEIGIDYIEGGWPGSNPKDAEFFRKAAGIRLRHGRLAAFGSTRKPGISAEEDNNLKALLAAGTPVVTIFGKSWDLHVKKALKTSPQENLAMIQESVAFLTAHGREVIYDAEHFFDGYRSDPQYAMATLQAARAGGAACLVLCDTNGGMLPMDLREIVVQVCKEIGAVIGIHTHDDAGLAVANALTAVIAGATHVQGTINGYGERCGNANLCTLIPNLQLKMNKKVLPSEKLRQLTSLAREVSQMTNIPLAGTQPYVGTSAFAHKGGVHVDAVSKNPHTYEHIEPSLVGNRRRVLVSELSGKSNVLYMAKEGNINLDGQLPATRRVLQKLKELEHQGYDFEDAQGSFALLVWKAMATYRRLFDLEGFRVTIGKVGKGEIHCEATLKVRVNDCLYHTAADGNGPVNALDGAIRKALEPAFPRLKKIRLTDYRVRVLDGRDGTAAKVMVRIESSDGNRSWGTIGVSENIIAASWQALEESIEYGILYPVKEDEVFLKQVTKDLQDAELALEKQRGLFKGGMINEN